MEITRKPEIREVKSAPVRKEIPTDYFRMPCRDIAQVQPAPNGTYQIRDSKGKLAPHITKDVGVLQGHSREFLVFKKDNVYVTCNALRQERNQLPASILGEFRQVSGNNIIFERNNMLYTYDKNFRQVSPPQRKLH